MPTAPQQLDRADLRGLPEHVRGQLAAAAASSDPAAIALVIKQICAGWPALGRRLSILADEFQFEAIELLAGDG